MSRGENMKATAQHARRAAKSRVAKEKPVPVAAGVGLGTLLEETEGGWRVRLGGREENLAVDPSVDPILLREAKQAGARVLVEDGGSTSIVGVVQTSRALKIDRQGAVNAQLASLGLRVDGDALIQTASSFLRLRGGEVELFGRQVLTRARETAKVLARMIRLN